MKHKKNIIMINKPVTSKQELIITDSFNQYRPTSLYHQTYKGPMELMCHKKHNGCSRVFLFFLQMEFFTNSEFTVGRRFFEKFNEFTEKNNGDSYKERSIWRAIEMLHEDEIIVKLGKCCYQLNPTFFWRGSNKDRLDLIRTLIETGILRKMNQIVQVKNALIKRKNQLY